jgi:penicillin-binding protein 1A
MARRLGIRTRVSRNAANALGGLREGVTPLDMAHAYGTIANSGKLTFGTMSPGDTEDRNAMPVPGPVGVQAIGRGKGDDFEPLEQGGSKLVNRVRTRSVLDPGIAGTVESILQTVVKSGTATRAFVPGVTIAGKTGTTEGYGDAWFVGWTEEFTIAVWVGYPDQFKPMETEFQGDPVAGGTYPAGIFKTFVEALVGMKLVKKDTPDTIAPLEPGTTAPAPVPGTETPAPETPAAPAPEGGGEVEGGGAPPVAEPAPEQEAAPAPEPEPVAPPAQPPPAEEGGGEAAPTG